MMPQGKTPAIFQHDSFQNGIALIFVHSESFLNVDSIRAKRGQTIVGYG